jgi:hypothetical protein
MQKQPRRRISSKHTSVNVSCREGKPLSVVVITLRSALNHRLSIMHEQPECDTNSKLLKLTIYSNSLHPNVVDILSNPVTKICCSVQMHHSRSSSFLVLVCLRTRKQHLFWFYNAIQKKTNTSAITSPSCVRDNASIDLNLTENRENIWSISSCVCPTGRKDTRTWSNVPRKRRKARYPNKNLDLFCLVVLSNWSKSFLGIRFSNNNIMFVRLIMQSTIIKKTLTCIQHSFYAFNGNVVTLFDIVQESENMWF